MLARSRSGWWTESECAVRLRGAGPGRLCHRWPAVGRVTDGSRLQCAVRLRGVESRQEMDCLMCRAKAACSAARRCSSRSTWHRGLAVRRSLFLLDVFGPMFLLDVLPCSWR
jgi:hypothetical protein